MDSNYEAQKNFTNQRLTARREQAAAERALREGRPARTNGLKQVFSYLFAITRFFRRPDRQGSEPEPQSKLVVTGKGKG
jgi:hypothetical protein